MATIDLLVLFSGVDDVPEQYAGAMLLVRAVDKTDAFRLVELAEEFNTPKRWAERGRRGTVDVRKAGSEAVSRAVPARLADVIVMLHGRGPVSASYADALRRSVEEAIDSDMPPSEREAVVSTYLAALDRLTPTEFRATTQTVPPPVPPTPVASSIASAYRRLLGKQHR